MRIGIAADHGGYAMKERMTVALKSAGHDVTDFEALQLDLADGCPDFVIPLSKRILQSGLGCVVFNLKVQCHFFKELVKHQTIRRFRSD